MVQCPDCEAKDRITIAGKVFCANCGAPWEPSNTSQSTAAAATPASSADTAKATEIATSAPLPSAATTLSMASSATNDSGGSQTATPVVAPTIATISSHATEQVKTETLATLPAPAEAQKEPASGSSTQKVLTRPVLPKSPLDVPKESTPAPAVPTVTASAASAPASAPQPEPEPVGTIKAFSGIADDSPTLHIRRNSAPKFSMIENRTSEQINKFQAINTAQANSDTIINETVTASARPPLSSKPAMPQRTAPAAPESYPVVSSINLPNATTAADGALLSQTMTAPPAKENADIEISSLDEKAQTVLSDEQFKDLATIETSAAVAIEQSADTVANSASASVPAPVAPSTSWPVPTSMQVAAPAPAVASDSTKTDEFPVVNVAAPITNGVPLNPPPPSNPTPPTVAPLPSANTMPVSFAMPAASSFDAPDESPALQPKRLQDMIITEQATPPPASTQVGGTAVNPVAIPTALPVSTPSAGGAMRPLKAAIIVVLALVVGGYIWQVNYPNLAIKIGANRAGISANLPNYLPNGWLVGKRVSSEAGKLSYMISSGDTSTKATITQTKTDWDSHALLENYVLSQTSEYTMLQSQGLTIFVYNGDQAVWVNRGSWFKIDATGSKLSQDQIIKIATGL